MKITLLSHHFAPEFEGGTELVVRAQALALIRRGHEVRIVAGCDLPHRGSDVLRERVGELSVGLLPRLPSEPYDLLLGRPRLASLIEAECAWADIVHVNHWSTLTSSLVRELGRRRPVVVSLHDLFVTCPRFFRVPHPSFEACPAQGWDVASCVACVRPDAAGQPDAELEQGLEQRRAAFQAELDAAGRVLIPSQAHLDKLSLFLRLPSQTSILPHGMCAEPGTNQQLPIPAAFSREEPLRVLFLGHRSKVKGVEDLVQALAGLEPELRAAVHLTLLGCELESGFDAGLRALGGELSMDLGEAYAVADLGSLLDRAGGAHLAALPSHVSESYGLVTDEAMGLGLPVWVADLGAPRERVGASGKVLPARAPGAWREAFRQLLGNPELLKEARRALPISPRTVDNAARDLEQIYHQLLSEA